MIDLTPEELALIQERRAAQQKERPTSFLELLKAARSIKKVEAPEKRSAHEEDVDLYALQDWEQGFIEPSPVPEPEPEGQVEQKVEAWSDEWSDVDLWDDPLHDTLALRAQRDTDDVILEASEEEGVHEKQGEAHFEASEDEPLYEGQAEQEDALCTPLNDRQLAFPMWVLSLQQYEGDECVDLTAFKEFFALKARVGRALKASKNEASVIKKLARQIKKGTLPLRDVPLAFQVGEVGSKTQQRLIGAPLLLDLIYESWEERLRTPR